MKKLFFVAFMLLSIVTYAKNIEKENSKFMSDQSELINKKRIGCAWSTTVIFYRASIKQVVSMDESKDAFEITYVIDRICTTCYQIGHQGVTSTTTCN